MRIAAIAALSLAVAGCQSATAPTSSSQPQEPAQVPEQTAPDTGKEAEPVKEEPTGAVTQEEAGIKLRIDMPEIEEFLGMSKEGAIIPALKQDAVPQGITYLEEQNWLITSHYKEDGSPSILSVIDAATDKLVKAVELYEDENKVYTGHAGGVTVSKNYIWISSGSHAYRISKDKLVAAEDGAKLVFEGSIQTDTRASFTIYNDGILWVGEYAQGTSYPTEKSHYMNNRDGKEHRAWAVGYKLDETTDLLPETKSAVEDTPVTPDYILSIPNMVQGMLVAGEDIWLSQSYGRNNASTLAGYKVSLTEEPHTTVTIGEESVPVWFLDSQNAVVSYTLPPMSEGIVDHEGTMYILFESGASKYVTSSSYPLDRILEWQWK